MADNMLQIHELVSLGRDLTGTDVLAVDTGALTAKVDYDSLKQEITDGDVKFNAAQSLTDAQKAQARGNIGAASAAEVGTVPSGSNLQGEVDDLKSALYYDGFYPDILDIYGDFSSASNNGVAYSWTKTENKHVCTVTTESTASALSTNRFLYHAFPATFMGDNRTYYFNVTITDPNIRLVLFMRKNGSVVVSRYKHGSFQFYAASELYDEILARLEVQSGTAANGTVSISIVSIPEITDDIAGAENYLPVPNINDNVTPDILAYLARYGVCRLGPGVYNIAALDMPDDTALIGCGAATVLKLNSILESNYAVKLGSRCTIANLSIVGADNDITPQSVVTNKRHGILWRGDFATSQNYATQPRMSMIHDVFISRFTGGGITCDNTGPGTFNNLEVCNAFIYNCGAGINVAYYSEFHKFTNVRTYGCYYGCINNGGNNVYTNCDFSRCTMAFYMDDSTPNNSHGSAVGCLFNHSGNDTGIGIKIDSCTHGFVFSGCQIFLSQIQIEASDGITFDSCNCGSTNCDITISGGGTIMFDNCIYQAQPTITISNNNNVHFINCYVDDTGAKVSSTKAYESMHDWAFGKYGNLTWAQGRITTTGGETGATNRIRTDRIIVDGIKKLLINAPEYASFTLAWYANDGSFMSPLVSYVLNGVRASNRMIVDAPQNAYYLRLVAGKTDNTDISTTYGDNITLYDFAACDNGEIITNPPMLTIIDDDSFKKFYTDLYPVMVAKNVSVASAVIVGRVGSNENYMTWDDIAVCNQAGLEILSHSYSHYSATDNVTMEQIATDYIRAKYALASHGIYSPDLIVFSGSTGLTDKFVKAAKQTYAGGFLAGDNKTNFKGLASYGVRRYRIGNNTDYHIDLDTLKGLIDNLSSGWMVWMLHTSDASWVTGTGEGSSAYILGQAVDYALSKGIPIVTAEYGFRAYSTKWDNTQVPTYD